MAILKVMPVVSLRIYIVDYKFKIFYKRTNKNIVNFSSINIIDTSHARTYFIHFTHLYFNYIQVYVYENLNSVPV